MLGRDQWLRPSVFEGSECRLVGERIAGEFAKVPIGHGTEAKDEDCGEPRYGNRPVVPEELRTVEDAAEEVAAGDDARTQHGDGGGPDVADGGGGTQRGL